jgi:tagatose 1,6-diphosphate aldolase
LDQLWITCQPDNLASRRTLERLGAEYAGILDVPCGYPLDAGIERKQEGMLPLADVLKKSAPEGADLKTLIS